MNIHITYIQITIIIKINLLKGAKKHMFDQSITNSKTCKSCIFRISCQHVDNCSECEFFGICEKDKLKYLRERKMTILDKTDERFARPKNLVQPV